MPCVGRNSGGYLALAENVIRAGERDWMLTNLECTHFFLPGDRVHVRAPLEIYVCARVGSVFEGVSIAARRAEAVTE